MLAAPIPVALSLASRSKAAATTTQQMNATKGERSAFPFRSRLRAYADNPKNVKTSTRNQPGKMEQAHIHQVDARDGLKNGTVSHARFSSVGNGERVQLMVMRLRKN